jgi:hypothetical protein
VEQHGLVKQVKAAFAELDGTTSKGTGSSRKSSQKPKETAATASQPDPDLQAENDVTDIKQANGQRSCRESQSQGRPSCCGHVPALNELAVYQHQVHVEQNH